MVFCLPFNLNNNNSKIHISYCCCCLVTQSYLTLCDLIDCSPPGSSVHGILQARILEWVAISSSRGSSRLGLIVHLLPWQMDSLSLSHQGSPPTAILADKWLLWKSCTDLLLSMMPFLSGWVRIMLPLHTPQCVSLDTSSGPHLIRVLLCLYYSSSPGFCWAKWMWPLPLLWTTCLVHKT